ncbi:MULTISPECIES: AI-2E family transporter [Rhodomicrobium]|uniref:AI-2E family transporter n=1 Tax=Rhodomicrobium TaxID=1068 RepID=UPI0014833ED2|nr:MULTISPECIES: AI-2E family transporter [Rhodomicrobium]
MRNNTGIERPAVAVSSTSRWASAANVSVVGLFFIAVMVVLYLTRAIAVPVVLALIIGTILAPMVTRVERHGVPRVVSTILIVLFLLAALVFFAIALTAPLTDWIGRASELGALLKSRLQDFRQPLSALQDLYGALQNIGGNAGQGTEAIKIEASANASIIETAISVLTPALSQLLIFFVSLIFYLIFKNDFKASAILAFSTRDTRLRILRIYNDVESRLARFFTTFTIINITLGAVITLAMWIVDMPNPLLWGVLAAVLNFLPYLGPAIVTIALIVASILSFPTLAQAALPPLIYTALHVLEGEFLTPSVLGYSLAVNPFLLFLSVIFWTWMWGPIGAFLAVPIAMVTVGVLQNLFPGPEHPSLP